MSKVGYKMTGSVIAGGIVRAGLEMKYHLSDCQSVA